MKMRILRSVEDLVLSLSLLSVGLFALVVDKEVVYLIPVTFGLIWFLFWGIAFYEVSDEMIREKICFVFSWSKIIYAECAETGLVTNKIYSPRIKNRHARWVYKHYIYFSENALSEEKRNYEYLDKENIKMLRYNKKLHNYLVSTPGMELEGELEEEKKK